MHAFAHITGGGLAANLARVLPAGVHGRVERGTWELPAVFRLVGEVGDVPADELERTLNMGVGMVAVLPERSVEPALALLADRGLEAWIAGTIEPATSVPEARSGSAELVGSYRS